MNKLPQSSKDKAMTVKSQFQPNLFSQ